MLAFAGDRSTPFDGESTTFRVSIDLDPGIYAGRGMVRHQRVTRVTAKGRGSARALSEIARELETLLR